MSGRACETVGIDLGTTYSSLAYMDEQFVPRVVLNENAVAAVPSVVLFDDEELLVGEMALEHSRTHADRTVQFIKNEMGTDWKRTFRGHQHTPESISAIILRHLVRMAEPQLGPIRQAVITVPAYFNERRRLATQSAGQIAGLEVVSTLNEPTAAVLADSVERRRNPKGTPAAPEEKVLVYDLGGGTFDVTIVHVTPDEIRELATEGNWNLGGKDWDQAVIELVAGRFQEKHGFDPRGDAQGAQDLQLACERAKRTLTNRKVAAIRIHADGRELATDVTREQFEAASESLLQSTRLTAELALDQAKLKWKDIARVVLVGGSTLMPAVKELIRREHGQVPETLVNPVLSVALGAAIYAHLLDSESQLKLVPLGAGAPPKPASVRFVTAHGLGLKVRSRDGQAWINDVRIPKGTLVPARSPAKRYSLTGTRSRDYVQIEITQGDSTDVDRIEILGEVRFDGFPPPEAGEAVPSGAPGDPPEAFDVTLEFDEAGRVQISAVYRDLRHGREFPLAAELKVEGALQPEEIEIQRRSLQEYERSA